jgi:hypothetical protein
MLEILKTLRDTPLPIVLVIGGLVFLLVPFIRRVSDKVEIETTNKGFAGIIGFILLAIGVGLYIVPSKETVASPTPTPNIIAIAPLTAVKSETPIPTLLAPSITLPTEIPPTLPVQTYSYGVIGQGQQQTTLTSPGICALYFYPFGGKEKTFVFKSENQVWVQNYNGTLSCWQTTPSLADVGTNHPFASYDEIQQAGVVFSGQIAYIDPSTLK